jgi:hypothetical protein
MMIARCNWQLDVLIDPDPSRQFAGYRPEPAESIRLRGNRDALVSIFEALMLVSNS